MVDLKTFVFRGKILESLHKAKCLVKNSKYEAILTTKNNQDYIYPRSSIKIFQAVPFFLSNANNLYNLNKKIIAISCSSHCGEKKHIKVLNEWIKKISLSPDQLRCGIHNPINLESSNKLLFNGNMPNQLHNNCAGKHLGMISGCMALNLSYNNYLNFNHPYQKLIRDSLEYFMNASIKEKSIGIDGCSAPQYAFKINDLANSMIKLFDPKQKRKDYFLAIKNLFNSIKIYPELIGGTNRFDSEIIKITDGRIFCKGGAEGVLLFSDTKKKIGGVIKIEDGNYRAIPSISLKIFNHLNLLKREEKNKLQKWSSESIYNHTRKKVGKIYSTIE